MSVLASTLFGSITTCSLQPVFAWFSSRTLIRRKNDTFWGCAFANLVKCELNCIEVVGPGYPARELGQDSGPRIKLPLEATE
jgi:hypothetical protein